MAYLNSGQIGAALQAHQRELDLNPSDTTVRSGLGTCLTLAGRPEKGVQQLKTGLRLNPRHPRIHLFQALLARAYLDAHQYEQAADEARKVIQSGKVYLDEHLVLASALGHLGRAEEAKSVLDDRDEFRVLQISDVVFCPWWQLYEKPEPNAHLFDGLRKAGLPD